MYYIYKIQNILTDEIIYIGCTGTKLKNRFCQHKEKSRQADISIYICEHGKCNFFIALIDKAETKKEALAKETFWTKFFMARCDTLLNKRAGSECSHLKNIPRTEEVKRKISEKTKGKIRTSEQRKNISLAHIGVQAGGKHPQARKTMLVNTGEIFETTREAEIKYSVSHQNIHNVCVGKRNYAGKLNGVPMVWKFVE